MAIARALSNIPGASIYVNMDGQVVVFDATDVGSAKSLLAASGYASDVGDYVRVVQQGRVRPREVWVYFAREVEMRFDFDEDAGAYASNKYDTFCENVLPLPDPTTVMADGSTKTQGTWVTIREALAAWQKAGQTGKHPYDLETVRKFLLQGELAEIWGANSKGDVITDGSIIARAHAVEQHFRRTFRVNREYAQRIRSFCAHRVAILDTATGQRAPAMAWGQYCVIPTDKARVIVGRKDKTKQAAAYNVDTYPGRDNELATQAASPASVSVIDEQLGVLRIEYATGPYALQEAIIPSLVGDSNGNPILPTRDLAKQDYQPITFGSHVEATKPSKFLLSSFKCAFVVTGQPAAPNNKRQFQLVKVSPKDVQTVAKGLGHDARGPVQEVIVHPSDGVTARFGWKDTTKCRATVATLLGIGDKPQNAGIYSEAALPGFVYVNGEDEIPANAKAIAAEVWSQYLDAPEGSHVTHWNSDARLAGNASMVQHVIDPQGRATTRISFSEDRARLNRYAMLPESIRYLTLRILDPKAV
jgi:hypothetical protein